MMQANTPRTHKSSAQRMLPSVLMKRTVEKLREREKVEEMEEIINSIRVGKVREAF